MPSYKLVFKYDDFFQGFTETYYRTAATAQQAATLSAAEAAKFSGFRALGNVFVSIEASQVDPIANRVNYLFPIPAGWQYNNTGSPADVTATTALYRLQSSPRGKRILDLRGLPDSYVTRGSQGESIPSPSFLSALNILRAYLINQNNGFTIQVLKGRGDSGYKEGIVYQLAPVNVQPSVTTISSSTPHNLNPGDRITFVGVRLNQFPGLKGIFTVLAIPSITTFTIGYTLLQGAPVFPVNVPRLLWKTAIYWYYPITQGNFVRFGTRKTGRPTTRVAGRGRAVSFRR